MFESINEMYREKVSNDYNNKLILEAVVGSDDIILDDEDEEAVVDVDSVNSKSLNKADDLLNKIIEEDKDGDLDMDIDELLDDDVDDELDSIVVSDEVIE